MTLHEIINNLTECQLKVFIIQLQELSKSNPVKLIKYFNDDDWEFQVHGNELICYVYDETLLEFTRSDNFNYELNIVGDVFKLPL